MNQSRINNIFIMQNLTVSRLASMIDHSILHPTATDSDLIVGCGVAMKWNVASVCVKPYWVSKTVELLEGSRIPACTVIGFPHGSQATSNKIAETYQAINDGATELDMVVNVGKVLGGDIAYVEKEIELVNTLCIKSNAILKVIFENDFLPTDDTKIQLVEVCREIGVAFVKTSSGYGFVKQPDGTFATRGATIHDCRLMVKHAGPHTRVKAAGGIRSLADVLPLYELGVARFGCTATDSILTELAGNTDVQSGSNGY